METSDEDFPQNETGPFPALSNGTACTVHRQGGDPVVVSVVTVVAVCCMASAV